MVQKLHLGDTSGENSLLYRTKSKETKEIKNFGGEESIKFC